MSELLERLGNDLGTRTLSFDRPLPHPLVHKAGIGEVFLTDHAPLPGGGVLLAGELPAAHRYFNDLPSPRLDLLPLLELCRQGCFVYAHAHHGVPAGRRFVLRRLTARLTGAGSAARRVLAETRAAETTARGLTLDFTVRDEEGAGLAEVSAAFTWADERAWRRLRASRRARYGLPEHPGPAPRTGTFPAARGVGRTSDANVVIADPAWTRGSATAKLSLDPANPAMFERPPGHLTGLALVEAARQGSLWALSRHLAVPAGQLTITTLDAGFSCLGELDLPAACEATVTADRGGRGAVTVRIVQAGRTLATAAVEAVRAP